ncbi:hypothetical protein GCM10027277_31560 [Pseudoduganella ginsengisoli]
MSSPPSNRKLVSIAFAIQYVEMVIQFVAVMILARLLSPSEIGTYSVAAFLTAMLHVLRDFGIAQYVIQTPDLTPAKLRSAMGMAWLLAGLVGAILLAFSGVAAQFYAKPELQALLTVMAASFALSPLGSITVNVLRRESRLDAVFWVRVGSTLSHTAVSIGLAAAGLGAISLAWANLASVCAFGLIANMARPAGMPWLPSFRNLRPVLAFGSVSSLGSAAQMAGTALPELIMGKTMNMAAVGYFSRATGLVQLFSRLVGEALSPLVLPYFSQTRNQGQALAPSYLHSVRLVTALAWPFYLVLAIVAEPMVSLLYGGQWAPSVPVVRLLCVASAASAVSLFATQAMVANRCLRASTMYSIITQGMKIAAVLATSTHDIATVGMALAAAECIALAVSCWFLRHTLDITPGQLLQTCRDSAFVASAAALPPWLVHVALARLSPALALPLCIAAAAVGWLGSLVWTRHPLGEQIVHILATPAVARRLPSGWLARLADWMRQRVPPVPLLSLPAILPGCGPAPRSVEDAGHHIPVSSGRIAMALALQAMAVQPGEKVLLPAWHSQAMVPPVLWRDAIPVFYRMHADGAINLDDVAAKLDGVRVLVVSHYYGFAQDMAAIRAFCDAHGLLLLEDCAHRFFSVGNAHPPGWHGDYAIASGMKFFPVYEGGTLLSSRHRLDGIALHSGGKGFEAKAVLGVLDKSFSHRRLPLAAAMLAPLLAVKQMLWRRYKQQRPATQALSPASSDSSFDFDPRWLHVRSAIFSRLVLHLVSRKRIAAGRRRHYLALQQAVAGLPGCRPWQPALPPDVVPWAFPLWIADADTVCEKLLADGVPLIRFGQPAWPGSQGVCANTDAIAAHVVGLPCHQGLRAAELARVIDCVQRALKPA